MIGKTLVIIIKWQQGVSYVSSAALCFCACLFNELNIFILRLLWVRKNTCLFKWSQWIRWNNPVKLRELSLVLKTMQLCWKADWKWLLSSPVLGLTFTSSSSWLWLTQVCWDRNSIFWDRMATRWALWQRKSSQMWQVHTAFHGYGLLNLKIGKHCCELMSVKCLLIATCASSHSDAFTSDIDIISTKDHSIFWPTVF